MTRRPEGVLLHPAFLDLSHLGKSFVESGRGRLGPVRLHPDMHHMLHRMGNAICREENLGMNEDQ